MRRTITAVSMILLLAAAATAEPLRPGQQMPAFTLNDQHDVPATMAADTRIVIFTRDMDGAGIVKEALAQDGAALLAGAGAVFVSDIHRMPGVITTIFALPSMRKRPYRMVLDREGEVTADLPSQEEKVSVIRLNQLKIESVEYIGDATQLRAALQSAAKPADGQPSGETGK